MAQYNYPVMYGEQPSSRTCFHGGRSSIPIPDRRVPSQSMYCFIGHFIVFVVPGRITQRIASIISIISKISTGGIILSLSLWLHVLLELHKEDVGVGDLGTNHIPSVSVTSHTNNRRTIRIRNRCWWTRRLIPESGICHHNTKEVRRQVLGPRPVECSRDLPVFDTLVISYLPQYRVSTLQSSVRSQHELTVEFVEAFWMDSHFSFPEYCGGASPRSSTIVTPSSDPSRVTCSSMWCSQLSSRSNS